MVEMMLAVFSFQTAKIIMPVEERAFITAKVEQCSRLVASNSDSEAERERS